MTDIPGWPYGQKYEVVLADPPWHFQSWAPEKAGREVPYNTMSLDDIKALPVQDIAADDCVLFLWIVWPNLLDAIEVIKAWGFEYKTCAFAWIKADGSQVDMFHEEVKADMGLGYWTRANSEVCLLGTRGSPRRVDAGVRQAIIEPRREHSRKPSCVYDRIERLMGRDTRRIELFARTQRANWHCWGNQTDKFRSTG